MIGVPDINFDAGKIHSQLIAVTARSTKKVIGYVNKNPDDSGWFWFRGIFKSLRTWNNPDDAISDLIQTFFINKMDESANKLGILNDEQYVKGR